MKIINPDVEIIDKITNILQVDECARICYRSEQKNPDALYKALETRGHLSMFRHESYYYVLDLEYNKFSHTYLNYLKNLFLHSPFVGFEKFESHKCAIAINGQFYREHKEICDVLEEYRVSKEYAKNHIGFRNIYRITFKITTQISTSRELNRVSPNNISEQSTRYVYDDGTLCKPWWITDEDVRLFNERLLETNTPAGQFLYTTDAIFDTYVSLINSGVDKQDARGILPLDTATVCAYTYSIEEWRHILDLRYYGKTGKPHKNAKAIATFIKEQLNNLNYDV